MGAPGICFFCGLGHIFGWIEERLEWDESLKASSLKISKEGCPCGNKEVFKVYHYGGINDCICSGEEIPTKGILDTGKVDEIITSIPDAIDKDGNPIKAYRKMLFKVYKIPKEVKTMYRTI